jgi:hypothetical protein
MSDRRSSPCASKTIVLFISFQPTTSLSAVVPIFLQISFLFRLPFLSSSVSSSNFHISFRFDQHSISDPFLYSSLLLLSLSLSFFAFFFATGHMQQALAVNVRSRVRFARSPQFFVAAVAVARFLGVSRLRVFPFLSSKFKPLSSHIR